MSKIQIITDSDSSLSPEIATRFGIIVVPITVQFGQETYSTNVDINDMQLFEKIDRLGKLPTTAAPSPAAFTKAFTSAFQAGADEILCICVSSKVSSTYESALLAAREFPEKQIRVIDSLYMTMGQGFLAIAVAEAIAKGATLDEAAKIATGMIPGLCTYASFATLKYLAMSGRVGKLVAGMAGVLDIRPLLTMKDGTLQMLEKVRTRKNAMDRLVNLIVTAISNKQISKAAIYHVNNPDDAKILEARLREKLQLPDEVFTVEFSAGLSVHAGTGMVGAVFYTK
ncbi:MAG: DegV family protein [Anaerolineaceae bacterium]